MDYFLLDLERTLGFGKPYFWKRNKHGYTPDIQFAGVFPENIASEIVKRDLDKRTVMISVDLIQKTMVLDLKAHEGN